MQQILERLIFAPEKKQDIKGLALIPAPTGFGKTYVTCDFIARNIERLIEQGIKIIFVTPLIKNLPIHTLKQAFARHGKADLFEQVFLRLPNRYDTFNDTFDEQFENVISAMPEELKQKAGFKKVDALLRQNKQLSAKLINNQAWSKLYDLDKRFREVETEFRRELKREVFPEKATKSEKKKILNQPDNQWVYRLYPEALFDDKPIVMMSMTKFLMPFSTLVESAYPLVEKLKAPGLVELNIYQQSGMLGYSVGIPRGALQQTFERGSSIRWIKSLNDQPIEIEKTSALLADLLDVDFIQAKQSGTVWPFVFRL